MPQRSVVPDQVSRHDQGVALVRQNDGHRVGVAVEGRRVERAVIIHFRANFDLRRKPVLPADTEIYVAGFRAGPLPLHTIKEFGSERQIIERRKLMVQIHHGAQRSRYAGEHRGIAALRKKRSIEFESVDRRERKATAGDNPERIRYVQYIPLFVHIGLPGKVPVGVEPVIPSQSRPLQVIISPGAVIDAVFHHVDAVPAVALPARASRVGELGAGVFRHGGVREHRIRKRVGHSRTNVPAHRIGAAGHADLQNQVPVEGERADNAGVGETIERVGQRMDVHVVVGGQLGLDVRYRNEAPEAHQQAISELRHEDFAYSIGES
jgi:hypothetical protein